MSTTSSDPISVFREAADAVEAEDWERAAALCDPATLMLYKREIVERLERPREPWNAERVLRYRRDLPAEAAEFEAAQLESMEDPERILRDELPSVSSVEALRNMTPRSVFAAYLEGQSIARQLERLQRDAGLPPGLIPQGPWPRNHYTVIGCVTDGGDLAHVVFRREADFGSESEAIEPITWPADYPESEIAAATDEQRAHVMVAPLRRQADGSWRMMAGPLFLGPNNAAISFGFDPDGMDELEM